MRTDSGYAMNMADFATVFLFPSQQALDMQELVLLLLLLLNPVSVEQKIGAVGFRFHFVCNFGLHRPLFRGEHE